MRKMIACLLLLQTGCATLFQAGPDKVMVTSDPPGATVKLDGVPQGKTPMQLAIGRKSEGVITLEMEGYQPVTIDRDKSLAGWFLVDFLALGTPLFLSMVVDLATSNQGKYSEEPVYIDFKGSRAPAGN